MTAKPGASDRKETVRNLRQLIEALNRRVPHIERLGEEQIARDAEELRLRAEKRLKALEDGE